MFPIALLDSIQDYKLRVFLETQYMKIHAKLGHLFDVLVKELNVDSVFYDIDDVIYKEVIVDFALVPRPEVVFLSTHRSIEDIGLSNTTKVVRVQPSNPFSPVITRYNLHKLMCPTFHSLNLNTCIGNTIIRSTVKLYSSDVMETTYGGVVAAPLYLNRL